MIILGVDPSLTSTGIVVLDKSGVLIHREVLHTKPQIGKGKDKRDTWVVERLLTQKARIEDIFKKFEITDVCIEAPLQGSYSTEILYAVQMFYHAACYQAGVRTLWINNTAWKGLNNIPTKSGAAKLASIDLARKLLNQTTGKFSDHEADAYHVARCGKRFLELLDGIIEESDLTPQERSTYLKSHTMTRGKNIGQVNKTGMMFKIKENLFNYHTTPTTGDTNGRSTSSARSTNEIKKKRKGHGG